MAILNIKIVGIEDNSVLVKYASENSAKSIDDYEAVAFQPKIFGALTVEEFFSAVRPTLTSSVTARDHLEQLENVSLDLSSWNGASTVTTTVVVINNDSEVVL